jgi:glycosyltransferase involved in cell wall biosynthesis
MIEPVCAHGGMDYYDFSLCRGLINAGHEVKLYTSEAGPLAPNDIEVKETFKGVFGKAPRLLRATRWIIALVITMKEAQAFGANVLHFHFFHTGPMEKFSVWIAKKWGHTVIATIHDVESFHKKKSRKSTARLLSKPDGIIAHNETSKLEISKLIGHEPNNMAIIPHGHYLNFIGSETQKQEARKHIDIPQDSPTFLFFGQIKKVKGLDIALHALSVVKKSVPDVKLVVAGKVWKDDFSYYETLIKQLGLKDNVILHIGYVPQNIVDNYYYASDAVILPYKRIYQSGVLLMAMSYGKPVIASDLPGMSEIITDKKNGLLFRSEDSNSLAQCMNKIIQDPAFAVKYGRNGREYVREKHDWSLIGKNTGDFYRTVLMARESSN